MILFDVDPNIVKPGWSAFLVVILLAIAMVFLYLSMRKQFRKIRTPDDEASEGAEDSTAQQPPGTQG